MFTFLVIFESCAGAHFLFQCHQQLFTYFALHCSGQFGIHRGGWSLTRPPLSCHLHNPCGRVFIIPWCCGLTWHSSEVLCRRWYTGSLCISGRQASLLFGSLGQTAGRVFFLYHLCFSPLRVWSTPTSGPLHPLVLPSLPVLSLLTFPMWLSMLLWGINGFTQYLACDKRYPSSGVMVVVILTECLSLGSSVTKFALFRRKNLFWCWELSAELGLWWVRCVCVARGAIATVPYPCFLLFPEFP